jgi:hypothetical protein
MKKPLHARILFVIVIVLLLTAGCGTEKQAVPADEVAGVEETQTAVTPTPRATATVAVTQGPSISDQPYAPASATFQINLPSDWNCSESGAFQVNCESPASDAALQARVTSTGYALTDESLFAFAHAELVHRYSSKKEYVEIERREEAGRVTNRASWRDGDIYWESTDTFVRNGRGVFHLTVAAARDQAEAYAVLFNAVDDSVKVFPENLTREALYPFRKTVAARDAFFEIEVPTSWGRYVDSVAVDKTIVEGYTSPDQRASVQIALYKQGSLIEKDAKAFNTREIMFALYGFDLRNSDDRQLPDGRERLTWYAQGKDIYGITDFDSYSNALYLFTVTWELSTEALYLPVLNDIQESFTRE